MPSARKPDMTAGNKNYKIKNTSDVSAQTLAEMERNVRAVMTGEADPKKVRAWAEQKYNEAINQFAWPDANGIPGSKMIRIIFRSGDMKPVKLYWRYLPRTSGSPRILLAVCLSCYLNAPSQVSTQNVTKPTIIDGYIARVQGDPEADNKLVPFSVQEPAFTIDYHTGPKGQDLVSVKQIIRCPNYPTRCSFAVRLEDSIATKVSGRITRGSSGKGGPITGPLIQIK